MQEHELTLVRWLAAHGPDDWHQVAIDWNWDAGLAVLAWIAAQPDCDRATAQYLILNGGGADWLLPFADRAAVMADASYNVEPYDLLLPVVTRWNAGLYTRSAIASDMPARLAQQEQAYRDAVAALAGRPAAWSLDPSVFRPLAGQTFTTRYAEGWPPDVAADLKARRIAF